MLTDAQIGQATNALKVAFQRQGFSIEASGQLAQAAIGPLSAANAGQLEAGELSDAVRAEVRSAMVNLEAAGLDDAAAAARAAVVEEEAVDALAPFVRLIKIV